MIATLPHIAQVMDTVRDGLHGWMGEILKAGGVDLPVVGSVQEGGKPALVLLPYQLVLESHAQTPTIVLLPGTKEPAVDAMPLPWRRLGVLMTTVLLETFPSREKKAPGLGPVDPMPLLSELPKPIRAWYEAHGDGWVLGGKEPRGRLPAVNWRQPFSLATRIAAMVPAGNAPPSRVDATQLKALALVGAAIRMERFFPVMEPPYIENGPLLDLMRAFAKVDHEAAAEIGEMIDLVSGPRELGVGLTAHNDLSDQDLALMMTSLKLPMQPTLVFSVRVALGAGPELGQGRLPHLNSVEGARR